MTTPELAIDTPNGRLYKIPGTDTYVPSVSTVLKEKRSPALANWDKKQIREEVCDVWVNHPSLYSMAEASSGAAKKEAINLYWEDMKRRNTTNLLLTVTEIGTCVHACIEHPDPLSQVEAAVERIAAESGRKISDEGMSAAVQDVRLKTLQVVQCIEKNKLEILHHEVTVFNAEHGYSGILDMIAWHPARGAFPEGTCVLDLKTGANLRHYDDNICQIAAYAHCDLYAASPHEARPFPFTEDYQPGVGGVLKATSYGSSFTLFGLKEGWKTFLAARQLHRWHAEWESLVYDN